MSRSRRWWWRATAALALLAGTCGRVIGAEPAAVDAPDSPAVLEQQVRQLALDGARAGTPGGPRIEVGVGQLDPRLHLAPCQRIEPYLPDGMRLWGRGRIGLRCTQGAIRWNVYLPVTVKAFATALVATSSLGVGAVLGAADVTQAEVDLAEDPSSAVADAELAVGRVLTRTLRPGQSIRQSHLKVRQWFNAGETVSLLLHGAGFSVESEGQALGNGLEGQPVRVRTDSGRIVTGQAVGGRRVELAL